MAYKRGLKLFVVPDLKRLSITKTKVYIIANHKGKQTMNQRILEVNEREKNAVCVRIMIGFGFTYD